MPPNFSEQIEQVRRRLVRRRAMAGACRVFAATVIAALGLMVVDRGLDLREPAERLLVSALLIAVGVWAVRRWFVQDGELPITRLNVALELERRCPKLRDLLASAVQFSEQSVNDPWAGSESLRRAVVLRAAQEVEEVDWERLIPRKPLRRAAAIAAVVSLVLGVFGWFAPQALGIGFARLVLPFSGVDWPREHDLAFIDPPALLAEGSEFELQLQDRRGLLPELVQIHYRTLRKGRSGNDRWQIETEPMVRSGERMLARRSAGQRRFEFRATGGDHHSMPWHAVDVLPRPRIESLEIKAHPPDYSGMAVETIHQPYRVLAGTCLEVVGKASQPLRAAELHNQQGVVSIAEIDSDGRTFHFDPQAVGSKAWRAEESGLFWLELMTTAGLVSRLQEPVLLEVMPDLPPTIEVVQPRGDLSVVADAQIEMVVSASDDLAIREIAMVIRSGDRLPESEVPGEVVPIYRRVELPQTVSIGSVDRREVAHTLELAGRELQPGDVLEIDARASDYYPISRQTGHRVGQANRPLRLTIISREEFLRQLRARQTRIIELLSAALDRQRNVRGRVSDWQQKDQLAARLQREGHSALYSQRHVADMLASSADAGAAACVTNEIDALLQSLRTNRLDKPETQRQLGMVRAELLQLAGRELPAIEQQLSDIIKRAQRESDPEQEQRQQSALSDLQRRQDVVIGVLERAHAELTRWSTLEQFAYELIHLRGEQQRLLDICQHKIAPSAWSTTARSSDHTLSLALPTAVAGQRQLSLRFGSLMASMQAAADRLVDEAPAAARRLTKVVRDARQLELQAMLRAASDRLAENRLGRAMSLQQQAIDALQRLVDTQQPADTRQRAKENGERTGKPKSSWPKDGKSGSGGQAGSTAATSPPQAAATTSPSAVQLDMVGQRIKDLWGQLPERDQQRILQPLSEDFLPKYAPAIRQYFRTLAEPDARPQTDWPIEPSEPTRRQP